jgi:REP element-mobilizing transposase RayT
MWNDTDEPIAYLITFRTYGTWLHGDKRGSVSRHYNTYGTRKLRHEPNWLKTNQNRLEAKTVILTARQRACVKRAIKETCRTRGWTLHSLNVRTNHIHAVISAIGKTPSAVLNALKANSTRIMRERNVWTSNRSPWVDKGSTRYLWNEKSVILACNYVEFGQGDDLPQYE